MKNKTFAASICFLFVCMSTAASHPLALSTGAQISVKKIEPFFYVSFRHTGPYSDIEPVILEMMQHMQNQNLTPAGPMMSIYYTDPVEGQEANTEWAVAFPVAQANMVQAPLVQGQWDYTQVVYTLHTGPYDKTGDTIEEMLSWIDEHGYERSGPIVGTYMNMPDANTPPNQLKTEIWIPVKKVD
ncbi:MAG: GyrI-like domain-containing protein [Candidatus Aminicenantes bacterium]|nr:GyrI-like domain-containing protein [Candidatus Aminicenantes bacterium]